MRSTLKKSFVSVVVPEIAERGISRDGLAVQIHAGIERDGSIESSRCVERQRSGLRSDGKDASPGIRTA